MFHNFHRNTVCSSTTVLNIDNNNKGFLSIMIFRGSCDPEDWSNDAEYSALIPGIIYILKCIQIENSYSILKCHNVY